MLRNEIIQEYWQTFLGGTPSDARASKTERVWLAPDDGKTSLPKVRKLSELARKRGQSLVLKNNLAALEKLSFSEDELDKTASILKE